MLRYIFIVHTFELQLSIETNIYIIKILYLGTAVHNSFKLHGNLWNELIM